MLNAVSCWLEKHKSYNKSLICLMLIIVILTLKELRSMKGFKEHVDEYLKQINIEMFTQRYKDAATWQN
jgi:hypothetical protein